MSAPGGRFVLALDQGTTSSRAILFDHSGKPVAIAQQEFEQIFPAPGQVEHDPEAIWESQLKVAREVLKSSGTSAQEIAAIGIANQRETTIVWDRVTGAPEANAIVWQSRVTAPICEELRRGGHEQKIRAKTGLVIDPYFSGTKLKHLLDTVPGLREKAEAGNALFGTVDSFLLWRLTGGKRHATDVSNASRTMLFNIHSCEWDEELLRLLDIPRAMLPEVLASSEMYGETEASLLGAEIPIAGIAGDQQAALFGQLCFQPGMAKATYGTGCFVLLNTGALAPPQLGGLVTTVGWKIGNELTYCVEGAVFIAGAVVQWMRDGLKAITQSADIEALSNSVRDSNGVYFVPAFVGLGAPYWDPDARGMIIGLTRESTVAHVARAAIEAIALQTRDVLEAIQRDAGIGLSELRVDGGASRNNSLMQFQADIMDVRVRRPRVTETTALGAAYLAGLATGFWKSRDELSEQWNLEREFVPKMVAPERNARYLRWVNAVERAKGWAKTRI
ncbi:MAG TPA: glycerol kinase GlpK [Terriglobales bacterium]|nr:glycerol kinase GlpK [Terriglobales bacterium]